MRNFLWLALGLGGCAAGADGPSARTWAYAEAQPDCAPWDGAATTIQLSDAPIGDSLSRPWVRLSIYRSVSGIDGRTRLEGSKPGSMWVESCPEDGACLSADEGWVDLRTEQGSLRGTYHLRLSDGRSESGSFVAVIRERQILCG
jgi:hypothetical protein